MNAHENPNFIELKKILDPDLLKIIDQRDSASIYLERLPKIYSPKNISTPTSEQRAWSLIALYFRDLGRFYQALSIMSALYDHMILFQEKTGQRAHKGMPLVWMSDFFQAMGYPLHSKRFLMLTLCEDAIRDNGIISPETTGTYFRLVWHQGLPDKELRRYAGEIYKLSLENPSLSMYPEWLLQKIDKDWITELPSPGESGTYIISKSYVRKLISKLGSGTGVELETLADYLLSSMPGCRTMMRQKSKSTDYDIVCSMEGFEVDFRSEFGRYFVCECKDWQKPADFSTIAKFCRVLDSTKSKFGILFSKTGISGKNKTLNAEREQLKVFQDRGMIIIVINLKDLRFVAQGGNFINLLKAKYEKVRLDLSKANI